MSQKRALVTGGAGFLGSHLCDALLGEGWNIIVFDSLLTGRNTNIDHLKNESRFEIVEKNINEPFDPGKVDYVFHFASPASPVDYGIHGIATLIKSLASLWLALWTVSRVAGPEPLADKCSTKHRRRTYTRPALNLRN